MRPCGRAASAFRDRPCQLPGRSSRCPHRVAPRGTLDADTAHHWQSLAVAYLVRGISVKDRIHFVGRRAVVISQRFVRSTARGAALLGRCVREFTPSPAGGALISRRPDHRYHAICGAFGSWAVRGGTHLHDRFFTTWGGLPRAQPIGIVVLRAPEQPT